MPPRKILDTWWRNDHAPTLIEECCEAVRRWNEEFLRHCAAPPLPTQTFMLYTTLWARKFPTIVVDCDNDHHYARIVCLLRTISSMDTLERTRLSKRTNQNYTFHLAEFYRRRERYSDVAFNASYCMERIWPTIHRIVAAWDAHLAYVRTEQGREHASQWKMRSVLEEDPTARLWIRWTKETLKHTTLVAMLKSMTEL